MLAIKEMSVASMYIFLYAMTFIPEISVNTAFYTAENTVPHHICDLTL